MKYHVSLLDAAGNQGRVTLTPNAPAAFVAASEATNHDEALEWPEHARATHSVERLGIMNKALADASEDARSFLNRFLRPPLFQLAYRRGFGTLYTALYRPSGRSLELIWPDAVWKLGMGSFAPGERTVTYSDSLRA
jgi:hypothetical protein